MVADVIPARTVIAVDRGRLENADWKRDRKLQSWKTVCELRWYRERDIRP